MFSERKLLFFLEKKSTEKMLTFLSAVIVVGLILLISKLRRANLSMQKCVHVVVLGDLGRSPRMCNHAIEFEKQKFNVQLVGYTGLNRIDWLIRKLSNLFAFLLPDPESGLGKNISNNKNIEISGLKPFPALEGESNWLIIEYLITPWRNLLGLPPVVVYALKILWQFAILFTRLCQLPKPDFICVQVKFTFFYISSYN